jgi:hypothetical protein
VVRCTGEHFVATRCATNGQNNKNKNKEEEKLSIMSSGSESDVSVANVLPAAAAPRTPRSLLPRISSFFIPF